MAYLFSPHAAEVRIGQPQSSTRNELALYVVHTRAEVTSPTNRPDIFLGPYNTYFMFQARFRAKSNDIPGGAISDQRSNGRGNGYYNFDE
ncbi:hypothetical protein [Bradyrhizobium diversitatis]|uniref:hypothetical protein n=1 Tax=Bradyrhizobium diversitatis TaxID=2755406 RepID=UPI0018D70850|nr:hypothetical protein [Bradyrhizobium diversitatis]